MLVPWCLVLSLLFSSSLDSFFLSIWIESFLWSLKVPNSWVRMLSTFGFWGLRMTWEWSGVGLKSFQFLHWSALFRSRVLYCTRFFSNFRCDYADRVITRCSECSMLVEILLDIRFTGWWSGYYSIFWCSPWWPPRLLLRVQILLCMIEQVISISMLYIILTVPCSKFGVRLFSTFRFWNWTCFGCQCIIYCY